MASHSGANFDHYWSYPDAHFWSKKAGGSWRCMRTPQFPLAAQRPSSVSLKSQTMIVPRSGSGVTVYRGRHPPEPHGRQPPSLAQNASATRR